MRDNTSWTSPQAPNPIFRMCLMLGSPPVVHWSSQLAGRVSFIPSTLQRSTFSSYPENDQGVIQGRNEAQRKKNLGASGETPLVWLVIIFSTSASAIPKELGLIDWSGQKSVIFSPIISHLAASPLTFFSWLVKFIYICLHTWTLITVRKR